MIDFSMFRGEPEPQPDRWAVFAPPQFAELPPEHQDQFLFLNADSTQQAYSSADRERVVCGDGWGNDPYADGCYTSVDRFDLRAPLEEWRSALKKWLYRRGVPFKTEVLLLPVFAAKNTPVVLTTWKMVIKYIDEVFGVDNLVVVGPSTQWSLYFHHDDIFHFAREKTWRAEADSADT